MFGIGMPELIVIFVVALVLFGPGKLPDVGKSLGEAIRGFKKAVNEPKDLPDQQPEQRKKEDPSKPN
jgi:sec-independent protein translocase protein TatA